MVNRRNNNNDQSDRNSPDSLKQINFQMQNTADEVTVL